MVGKAFLSTKYAKYMKREGKRRLEIWDLRFQTGDSRVGRRASAFVKTTAAKLLASPKESQSRTLNIER
jgi:hypothetical protein